jgi:hypothetical protein
MAGFSGLNGEGGAKLSDDPSIVVEFQFTQAEFERDCRSAYLHNSGWRTLLCSAILVLCGALTVIDSNRVYQAFGLSFLVLAAACLLSGVGCMFLAPRKAWKAVDDFRGVRRYVFSDSVVEGQSVNLETRRRWTTFRSFEEARDGYRLWESGSNSWIAIPKRSFVTAADQSAFRRLVAEKVGPQSHSESSRQSP